jgi:polysaccharide biosynthesis/export protein
MKSRAFLLRLFCVVLLSTTAVRGGTDYRVGSQDLVRIAVFDHPELGSEARISESGNLTYPLLGQIRVAGMTTHEVEATLVHGLSMGGFVHQPRVSVEVVEFESQKVSVMGEVAKPGQYALTASQRAIELLAQAGGPVNVAAADQAVLIHRDGTKADIDLIAMFAGNPEQNPLVAAGDTLYVPQAPRFYIYGEVQRPGMYRLERGMTVSQAISAGGGLTAKGTERSVVVKRRDTGGSEQKLNVRGFDQLQANDILLVRETLF